MPLGPGSLSGCFLTRKMDYAGNSISNKISIHLKEFQDFYWEYLTMVFPLRLREPLSPSCHVWACCGRASGREKDGISLLAPKGKILTKAILSSLKSQPHSCRRHKGNAEVYTAC